MFNSFFDLSILASANRHQKDALLRKHYNELELATKKKKAQGPNPYLHITYDIEIKQAKDAFLSRLSQLEDTEKVLQLERSSQERDIELLELQKEVTTLAQRGHKLTARATFFAIVASVFSVVGIIVAFLQIAESKKANFLMEMQNQIMQEQNKIAEKSLSATKTFHSTEQQSKNKLGN